MFTATPPMNSLWDHFVLERMEAVGPFVSRPWAAPEPSTILHLLMLRPFRIREVVGLCATRAEMHTASSAGASWME